MGGFHVHLAGLTLAEAPVKRVSVYCLPSLQSFAVYRAQN